MQFEWKDGCVMYRLPADIQEKLETAKPGDEFALPDGTKLHIKDKDDTDDFWAWCREVFEDVPKTKLVQLGEDGVPARAWEMDPAKPYIREPYNLVPEDSDVVTVTQLDLAYEDPIPPEMKPNGED